MRAIQVHTLTGPDDVVVADIPEPEPLDDHVLVEVHRVGVAFPDLLLSRGMYQMKPEPPFTLGVDFAGTVVSGEGFEPGQRVAGAMPWVMAAERALVPRQFVRSLPDALSFDEGAALPMNYLTAHFTLDTRGHVQPGETVLVTGAAGGVGTACLQVAKGMGAKTIAVVSTREKAEFVKGVGADEAVLVEGFKDTVKELTGGRGVDAVVDVVGGDLFLDALRTLAPMGRLLVVGFTQGSIPEVKVNRLLLNNTDIRGAAWGSHAFLTPGYVDEQWEVLEPMIESGAIKPPIGKLYEFEEFGQALRDMDSRAALGKLVVKVRD